MQTMVLIWWQNGESELLFYAIYNFTFNNLFLVSLEINWPLSSIQVVGSWDDVLSMCVRGHLQPQVLFFESVNWFVYMKCSFKCLLL